MAVAWTDITNAQVSAGAPLTTALVTALRDNPEGIAQRASGAPKIFGNAYDYQEFTTNGTWTKPGNAESGDKVIVHVVGGGAGGGAGNPGGGGGGAYHVFDDITDLSATHAVVVGAGATGVGTTGGTSSFGTNATAAFLRGSGGSGAVGGYVSHYQASSTPQLPVGTTDTFKGGNPGSSTGGASSIYGGGGGTDAAPPTNGIGGFSAYAGHGGSAFAGVSDGEFPGGGGGGGGTTSGGDGVVRVWCVREEA